MSHDRRLNDLRSVFRVRHKRRVVNPVLVSKIDGEAVSVMQRASTTHSCAAPILVRQRHAGLSKLCRVIANRECAYIVTPKFGLVFQYTVISGDYCSKIESANGISDAPSQLHAVNPWLDSACGK